MEFIAFYGLSFVVGATLGCFIGMAIQDLRWRSYKKHAEILKEIDEGTIKQLYNAKDLMNSRLHNQKNQYEKNRSNLKKNIASRANQIDRELRGIFKILNNM